MTDVAAPTYSDIFDHLTKTFGLDNTRAFLQQHGTEFLNRVGAEGIRHQLTKDDGSKCSDGTPWHPHYPNQLEFDHFVLAMNPDEETGRVGFVHQETRGSGSTIATIFHKTDTGKYWAVLRAEARTPEVDSPAAALEHAVRLHHQAMEFTGDKAKVYGAMYDQALKISIQEGTMGEVGAWDDPGEAMKLADLVIGFVRVR
ncbi:hypothetical protein [Kitasatospora sp. NPDC098663]|uniref:hypothetical protein n=1 Tax=Kitasatospora sp. NPDC098663 TaxID=3364096 RepID=UPI0038122586